MGTSLDELKINTRRFWPLGLVLLITLLVGSLFLSQLGKSSIKVTSSPTGATVSLNGQKKGVTPLEVSGLDQGIYKVTLALSDYVTDQETVAVKKGSQALLVVSLSRAPLEQSVVNDRATDLSFSSGGKLLYSLALKTGGRDLWSYDPLSREKRKILSADQFRSTGVTWSKDGKAVLTDSKSSVKALSTNGLSDLPFKGYGFSWNGSGNLLAFYNDRFFSPNDPVGTSIYDLASNHVTNILPDNSVISRQTFISPDGNSILVQDITDEGGGSTRLLTVRPGTQVALDDLNDSHIVGWSEDSRSVLFQKGSGVYIWDLTSRASRAVYQQQDLSTSLLSSWSGSSRLLVVESNAQFGSAWDVGLDGTKKSLALGEELARVGAVASGSGQVAIATSTKLFILIPQR